MHGTDGVESGDVLLWQKLMVTMVCRSSETGLLQSWTASKVTFNPVANTQPAKIITSILLNIILIILNSGCDSDMGNSWPPVPGLWSLPPSSSPPSVLLDGSSSEYSRASWLSWFLSDDVHDLFLVGFSYLIEKKRLLRVEMSGMQLTSFGFRQHRSSKATKPGKMSTLPRTPGLPFYYYCWVKGKEKPQNALGWVLPCSLSN